LISILSVYTRGIPDSFSRVYTGRAGKVYKTKAEAEKQGKAIKASMNKRKK